MPNSVPRINHVAPVTHSVTASLTPATVALNIASHRDELFRLNPGAVELAAECVFGFHEAVNGSLTTVLPSRAGSYAREQGTGKRSLTLEDVCEMVTRGGSEGRSAVRALLAPIVDRLDGVTASMVGIGDAAADFDAESSDIGQAILRGKTDTDIRREIREAEDKLRILKGAVTAREDITRRLAQVCGGKQ
jgi:hypothetical protein